MPKEEVDALSKMVGLKPQSNDLVTPQQKERFERQERRHSAKPGTKARGAAKRRDADADIERFGKGDVKRGQHKPASQKTVSKPSSQKPSHSRSDLRKLPDNRAPRPRKKP